MQVAIKTRRTQEERTAETREKLLNATIDCLIKVGYAKTSTTLVAKEAGVSRGAQVHHFPKKSQLVIAAFEFLAQKRLQILHQNTISFPPGAQRIDAAMDLLWSAFSGPLFFAAVELWVAARTDEELFESLVPLEKRIGKSLYLACETIFNRSAKDDQDFREVLEMTKFVLRGMALERILKEDNGEREQFLMLWKKICNYFLSQGVPK